MKRLLDWIQGFAVTLGGPGLFLIGFLDSSFLSFPEVNDLLVVLMVTEHKHRLLYYSMMATLGSLAGCLALYYVARRGGEAFIRKRFKAHHVEAGLKLFQKYGLLMVTEHKHRLLYYSMMATLGSLAGCLALYYVARRGGEAFIRKRFKAHHVEGGLKLFQKYGLLMVIVPALLPPPAPFKIFVLLAGVAAIPVWQFATAVFIARFIRYFGEGLLAVYYGEQAAAFLEQHARETGLWLAGIAVVLGGAWILFTRRRRRRVEEIRGEQ